MKNRIIIAAIFTACLALCAAVWPQAENRETTHTAPITRRKRSRSDRCRTRRKIRSNTTVRERKNRESAAGASP